MKYYNYKTFTVNIIAIMADNYIYHHHHLVLCPKAGPWQPTLPFTSILCSSFHFWITSLYQSV